MLDSCGLLYVAKYGAESAPGIHKKVAATLKAAALMGYRTRSLSGVGIPPPRIRDMVREMLLARERYVLFRQIPEMALLFLPVLFIMRLQGKTVIVDVPTPNYVAVTEIWSQSVPLRLRLRRVLLVYLGGPFSLWPASRIVQYAAESPWFRFGNRSRTIVTGNGVDLDSIRTRTRSPPWPDDTLRLVAVATMTFWHGYDRLIRAVAEWNRNPARSYRVALTLVGDGRDRAKLRSLAKELGVAKEVTFTGMLDSRAIEAQYENAHLAVGSLGLHRKGLTGSAELKAREYCLAGIPFIGSGSDPDFPSGTPFRLVVSLDDSTRGLLEIFGNYGEIQSQFTVDGIRQYAVSNLGYASKLKRIGIPEAT